MHIFLGVAFFLSFFYTECTNTFCVRYKIDVISSNVHKSVVWMKQVFALERMFLLPSAHHY